MSISLRLCFLFIFFVHLGVEHIQYLVVGGLCFLTCFNSLFEFKC